MMDVAERKITTILSRIQSIENNGNKEITTPRKIVFNRTNQVLIDLFVFGFSWIAAYFLL